MKSVGELLRAHKGVGPGFDLLRIGLAVLIFAGHVRWLSGGGSLVPFAASDPAQASSLLVASAHWGGLGRLKIVLVPMFFALSGFLIMGSAARLRSPLVFLFHRVLRIFPALMVEICLSALVLGPLLTAAPLHRYFADPKFFAYFGNCLGIVTFKLPSLFESNPVPEVVNLNLWTLPSELDCYVITISLMTFSLIYSRTVYSVLFLVATAALVGLHAATGLSTPHGPYPLHVLTYYFFAGIFVFHWQDKVPARIDLAILCMIVAFTTIFFNSLIYVTPLFLTLIVVYIGIIPFPRFSLVSGGDYSYGIYLYGFPIAQAVMHLLPGLRGHAYAAFLISGLCTMLFAVSSWHLIEKNALKLRFLVKKSTQKPLAGANVPIAGIESQTAGLLEQPKI